VDRGLQLSSYTKSIGVYGWESSAPLPQVTRVVSSLVHEYVSLARDATSQLLNSTFISATLAKLAFTMSDSPESDLDTLTNASYIANSSRMLAPGSLHDETVVAPICAGPTAMEDGMSALCNLEQFWHGTQYLYRGPAKEPPVAHSEPVLAQSTPNLDSRGDESDNQIAKAHTDSTPYLEPGFSTDLMLYKNPISAYASQSLVVLRNTTYAVSSLVGQYISTVQEAASRLLDSASALLPSRSVSLSACLFPPRFGDGSDSPGRCLTGVKFSFFAVKDCGVSMQCDCKLVDGPLLGEAKTGCMRELSASGKRWETYMARYGHIIRLLGFATPPH
jgi:hypothetical protein